MTARYIIGDTREVTATLPDSSVDLVFTSPPFLALRSYLPADHPAKASEIGSEATPAEFLGVLLDLTEEWGRVLTPTGTIAVELGDTYSGSGGAGGDYTNDDGLRAGQATFRQSKGTGWPLAKSLCGIPTLYAWSLAYGRNLLAPEQTFAPWRIRNVIVWHRPNPPVGALGDKFRPSTSYITVATRSAKRWFDLDAVRTEHARPPESNGLRHGSFGHDDARNHNHGKDEYANGGNPAAAPPLDAWFDAHDGDDCWTITTDPYKGSHYATFPRALARRVIESMCPMEVCVECGEPRRRIVAKSPQYEAFRSGKLAQIAAGATSDRDVAIRPTGFANAGTAMNAEYTTLGWSDCGHDNWRPGVVFDPFAGSGTTLQVATGLGRHAIGIDLDERNAELARERCGMFLDVDHLEPTP